MIKDLILGNNYSKKELVEILRSRPPIKIPIQEWEYPKHSYDKDLFDELTKASENADVKSASSSQAHAVSTKEKNFEKTIETIIRKTRKQTREDLLVLRNKIYTIMTNHTAFDHWDNILSTKIIKNILDNKIFTSSDFKSSDMKPGYLWKTAFKKDTELFIERDRESVELMDLQINQFWGEVQDVTRNYFFDYDYIYNNKNKPWAKASLKYSEKDFLENTILYNEVFNYLQKIIPAINIDEKPFNEFSLSFVRALNKNIDEFPNDELIWEEVGEGFVIKKIRKDSTK